MQCPNCHTELASDAKFCSQCGTPIPPLTEKEPLDQETTVPETEGEVTLPEEALAVAEEEPALSEEAAPTPAAFAKRSRKGVFVSVLLAILVVVCMYVFYGELGFDTPKNKGNDAILYVKNGELFYNDQNGKEVQLTKDLASAVTEVDLLDELVKLSTDGKTVFYPDRTGADGKGVSLYCMHIGSDQPPVKLGNGIVSYQVLSDGKTVYYLDAEGNLFLHDQKNKTKLRSAVTAMYPTDGMDYLYCQTENGIYFHQKEQTIQLANDSVALLANGAGMLVCREGEKTYVIQADRAMEWNLPEHATQIKISLSGKELYYCEAAGELFDLYSATVRDGKMEAARLWETDINSYIVTQTSAIAFKDANEARGTADLYCNGVLLGYDVLTAKVQAVGNQIAFLADYDENSGTLMLYNGKKARSVQTDVFDLQITSSGKLVYLADVAKKSGTGDLYRYGEKAELIAGDVSKIIGIKIFLK